MSLSFCYDKAMTKFLLISEDREKEKIINETCSSDEIITTTDETFIFDTLKVEEPDIVVIDGDLETLDLKSLCRKMDKHIRYRLRMCIWKQWKTPQNRAKNLIKLGVNKNIAWTTAYTGKRIAYVCQRRVMNFAINKERLTRFGLVSMLDYYTERCVTC